MSDIPAEVQEVLIMWRWSWSELVVLVASGVVGQQLELCMMPGVR